MPPPNIIAANERTAAKMLDMPQTEFRRLVEMGALPGPMQIGPHKRWRVVDLEAVVGGDAASPCRDIEL